MESIPIPLLGGAVFCVAALLIILNMLHLPKSYLANEEKREELRRRVLENPELAVRDTRDEND